jgi:hypothetical protein
LQDCVADEAHDSDAEVEQIVADVKSGRRVTALAMMYKHEPFLRFECSLLILAQREP